MTTFPQLETGRLRLRKIQLDDIDCLVRYANNRKISDYVLNIPHPYGEPDAVFRISYVLQGFKNKSRYVFAIILKERNELVGEIALHLDHQHTAQLGYWVGEPFWGNGIATEAVIVVLRFGFETLGLDKIYATCHEENLASVKVLLKNRMKKAGTGGSIIQYQLTRQEYDDQKIE